MSTQGIMRDFEQMTRQKSEPDLFLGAGITCGPAMVGNFGNGDMVSFTAIGSTVNLAARVQGIAKNNQIYVTKRVAEVLEDSMYESKGFQRFKNVNKPVEIFEIK